MDILNEKIKGLVTKADKSGMPYNILKKVYDRGMAAWKTGHRPGTTPQQWAFARVNSFVTKSSGTWGKADKDLADKVRGAKKEEIENPKNAKDILGQIREARYKIGFEKGEVDMVISDRPGELAVIVQDELDSERIRAKVKSTGDEFTLEFNTSIPQRKMIKILDDKFGYTAFAEQIKEKLSKNADAGDYIDDFKKSDAPQFKGKSDKKKEKMAVAAYLDSKEEVEVKEENCPKCDDDPCKCENIQESGHTDVASMKTQVQIATDALQKMNTELGKLGDEDDLPTWWTNKVATAVNKLDGMADYIDAMHDRGKEMNEGKTVKESAFDSKRQLKDPKKETMVLMKKGNYKGQIFVIDKKDLPKFERQGAIQVESNLQEKDLDESLKFKYAVVDTSKNNEVIAMSSDEKEMKDTMRRRKKEGSLKVVKLKRPTTKDSMIGYPLKEEIELDEETVFVVRFEKEGMRFAVPFRDMKMAKDGEKILKKSAGVSGLSITKDVLKPGIKFSRKEGRIVKEENLEVKEGTWELPKTSKQKAGLKHAMKIPIKLGKEGQNARNVIGPFIGDDVLFDDLMDAGDKNPRGDARPIIKKAMKRLGIKEEVSEVQEVDNSLAAQATRLISQTAIREKKDPADIDVTATDLDRKAADKNIFVQLKRAQDMKGKGDIEFLDKKKKKVDIKIINKAIDMMMKMKPADRAKMQTAIGKSYRDLLKTVQRGKV